MADTPDKGNPNFFKTFKGRYELTVAPSGAEVDNVTVMLSSVNDVQVIGDFTLTDYTAKTVFATLPEECRPDKTVRIPVVIGSTTDITVANMIDILTVEPNGEMSLWLDHDGTNKLYMSGINFNISDRWY
jgi:hypothetical protein